jgi:propanol-preferring alcohol dehydrogenase
MKAGQWDPKQDKVVINEVPKPEPGLNEIVVKITSASLCHTDIMAIERPDLEEPFTLGHEGVGIIDQIHPSVEGKGYKIGDAIGFLYILGCCFECEGCMVHNLLCLNGEPGIQGFGKPGFFAEYAIVDYRNAIRLPEKWSLKTSSVFFCAGITGKASRSLSFCPCVDIASFQRSRLLRSAAWPMARSHRSGRTRPARHTVRQSNGSECRRY